MFRRKSLLSSAGPSVLVSLVLCVLCIAAAVYLYQEQTTTVEALSEDVESRKIAQDLETILKSLVTLIGENNEQLEDLNLEAAEVLANCQEHANKPREIELVERLSASFGRYHDLWESRLTVPVQGRAAVRAAARSVLESDTLPLCRQLATFNVGEIDKSEQTHRKIARWLLPGLLLIGIIGAINGIYLGYSVARRLRRSVYQLSVSVRAAASRLGQDTPSVQLIENGDLRHVNEQMKTVVQEIEATVERLQQREREVLRADQLAAVGQLAAGIAHELRNPLTSIKMLVETNREEAEERGIPAEDLKLIEQEIRRMERHLHTFLDFARLPRPERRTCELAAVVDKTSALLGGRARQQRVILHFTPPGSPVVIEADPDQIQQVLVNLFLNALDAMPKGGNLEVELCPPADGQVALRVRDTGPGIAPSVMPRLFEPFFSSKQTGLGLGLVISRRIAEAHGGSLQAANRPAGGACFELRLPASAEVREAQGSQTTRRFSSQVKFRS